MTLYDKYLSSFAGQVIDDCIAWVVNIKDKGLDVVQLREELDTLKSRFNSMMGTIQGKIANIAQRMDSITDNVNDNKGDIELLKDAVSSIKVSVVNLGGLKIGITINDKLVHSEEILPISFSEKPIVGKSYAYGIVDRDFVNDLKTYVKSAIDGTLGEEEDFHPKWAELTDKIEGVKKLIVEKEEKITTRVEAIEIYKDLIKEP